MKIAAFLILAGALAAPPAFAQAPMHQGGSHGGMHGGAHGGMHGGSGAMPHGGMQGHGTKPGAHGQHGGAGPTEAADTAATKAFRDVNARMHRDMDIRFTNDVDVDFVRGMIPHHVGAVEMAKVVLEHSKDPEIRKLAEDVVRTQETEIAQMKAFLKRKGFDN